MHILKPPLLPIVTFAIGALLGTLVTHTASHRYSIQTGAGGLYFIKVDHLTGATWEHRVNESSWRRL